MTLPTQEEHLVSLRRRFHQYPEPSWCEYWTTSEIVEELDRIGVNEIHVGSEALDPSARMRVPATETRNTWRQRAEERGVRPKLLDEMEDGTGCVAVLRSGEGPHIGVRVDIDALPIQESGYDAHHPAVAGFRSRNDGYMHACGHDGHIAIGLGILEAIESSDFSGTLTLFFQPAEEVLGGAKAMARGPRVSGLNALLAVHLGLGCSSGEVVAGIEKPLSVKNLRAYMQGESAHAGVAPHDGRNAIQAMATAVQSLYGIPRHEEGLTRVNVGAVSGGDASNIIADTVEMDIEVRGGTDSLAEYMFDEVQRRLESSAATHDCEVDVQLLSEAPRADSDPALREYVRQAATESKRVETVTSTAEFGASEDATYLMNAAAEDGGESTYVLVGTDHPSGHHTPAFDIDESSLALGVEVLTRAILAYSRRNGSD